MDADECGARRYRFGRERVWTCDAETRFIRKVFEAFPGSIEVRGDGNPIPCEQLSLEAA
jgi:hypothetical protein